MSLPSSLTPLFNSGSSAAAAPVQIERSLRFNSADSAYLSRTPAVAGNRRTFTWAGWIKRCKLGSRQSIFSAGTGNQSGDPGGGFFFDSTTDTLSVVHGGATSAYLTTAQVFRDVSAWFHLVVAYDTTQGTPSNSTKIYVNGSQVTISGTYLSSNFQTDFNNTVIHGVGTRTDDGPLPSSTGDFYLADIHFIDGQALTPSSFTEVSATTGQLIPKAYTGTFGTNGFWLKFSDNSAATAAALGNDYSGNNNDWTPNNLSVTAGAGNDSLVDTPTSYGTPDTGVGGEVRGNYATLNPLDTNAPTTNGNLDVSNSSFNDTPATIHISSGKFYMEAVLTTASSTRLAGFTRASNSGKDHAAVDSFRIIYESAGASGFIARTGTGLDNTTGLDGYTTGDVIGFAIDITAGTISFYKNNVLINTTTNALITNTAWKFYVSGDSVSWAVNFGQRAFAYTAPSGFKALCDTNLPAPLTAKPNTLFDIRNGLSAQFTISDLNFTTGLVVGKSTNNNEYWIWADVVRSFLALRSNTTDPEGSGAAITNVSSTGYQSSNNWFTTSRVYVTYNWNAGDTTDPSNQAGSITSQVRANVSAGFSVVTWTGTGANATVGHGLGVAPGFIIIKNRSSATNWRVYHSALGNTKAIFLSTTGGSDTSSQYWNNTSPTSTVFSVGSDDGANGNTNLMVAYCFTPVVGYSSFGSYTGNGSADGPFIFTSFRPRWLLVKRTDSVIEWKILDTARSSTGNVVDDILYPDLSNAEGSNDSNHAYDFLSNGFKLRTSHTSSNASGGTYIYAAFAENPFQYARAR